ncbi:hypothetical protein AC249_AIPGENE7294 [Exaiptasia diaphana]|nr:hypothetical protein AC249_AIPGENE7294 [Exaiptasia diaphana]
MGWLFKATVLGATAVVAGVTGYMAWKYFTKPSDPEIDSSDDESWEEGCAKGESQRQPPAAQASTSSAPPPPKEAEKPPKKTGEKPVIKPAVAKTEAS